MALFAPDQALTDLLSLSSFEDRFDISEFIGAISDKLIAESKEDNGPFDPAPFIRTFESSVDTLLGIRKDVQEKKEALEASLRNAERDFSRRLIELNTGFESVGKSFGSMESKIGQVGKSAVRIGEQLESIHVSRQRAQAAHDLIDYYTQFSRSDTSRLDSLRKDGGKAGRRQVATILRRLLTVAKEVDLPDADKTRERIDKYCEQFEKDMLRLFDKSYRKGDPNMMGHCAQTLLDFNGGASCVGIYVNQHDFFISKQQLVEINTIDNGDMWQTLSDPDASPPKEEPGLVNLFNEIRYTVEQEYRIIQAVFPNPPVVMQDFLLRVFAQSIQQYLELLLEKAGSLSNLSFLRVLNLSHIQTSKLVDDLKVYDFSSSLTARTRTSTSNNLGSDMINATGHGGGATIAIGTMLENSMEELFVEYNEDAKYLEKECRNMSELYTAYLERFSKYHELAIKTKSTKLFDRLAALTSTAASGTTATTATTAAAQAQAAATAAFMNISGRIRGAGVGTTSPLPPIPPSEKEKSTNINPDVPTEAEGRLNIDVAEKMLKWHAEAVGRCVELSGDLPKSIFAMMKVLAEALARGYVETAMDSAMAVIEARDAKTEPDFQPIRTLKEVDMICHLWQQYTNIALLPLANTSVTVRREMLIYNNQTLSRVEGAVNGILQRIADSIIAWLSLQLNKQKKNDFRPKDDDLSFARVNTEPCDACCETLERVRDVARESLSGKNLEVFLTEIGVAFHTLLLDHLKKFPVSANGGLMLTKDLKTYQDIISSFNIPALSERFEFLRQLGNVFLVRPEILKSYITENYLGRIEPTLLRPYLAQRSDWAQFERAFDFATEEEISVPSATTSPSLGGGVTTFRDRLNAVNVSNRLSTMMRDLESMRIGGGGVNLVTGAAGNRLSAIGQFGLHPMALTAGINTPHATNGNL